MVYRGIIVELLFNVVHITHKYFELCLRVLHEKTESLNIAKILFCFVGDGII